MKASPVVLLSVLVLAVGGCWESSGSPTQLVDLGPLSFEVPVEWQRKDEARTRALTSMWTPPSNARKESVTVIRTARPHAGTGSTPAIETLPQQLVSAQQSLHEARISRVTPVTTVHGLRGTRVDLSYKPNGVDRTYRRVHVALVEDESTLIHVLYTAASPDDGLTAVQGVLDTIRSSGGQS